MKRHRELAFGVELVEGLPGSGKSFVGMEFLVQTILLERRSVYTNLPIRWRVLRHLLRLRGGEELAQLVSPLTEDHFRAFCLRAHAWERYQSSRKRQRAAFSVRRLYEAFCAEHGPEVPDVDDDNPDVEPNWIPAGSVIIIDEAHHWYPTDQQAKDPPELLGYLTMLRHHRHRLLVITQDRMQVSIRFRRLARGVWRVQGLADEEVGTLPLRLRHLGIRGNLYRYYTAEQEALGKLEKQRPARTLFRFPFTRKSKLLYRLYEAYTHGGAAHFLNSQLAARRAQAGVVPGPPVQLFRRRADIGGVALPQNPVRLTYILFVIAVFFAGFWAAGRFAGTPAASVLSPEASSAADWPAMQAMYADAVLLDGSRLPVGGTLDEIRLLHVDQPRGIALVERSDHVWMWRLGHLRPADLGQRDLAHAAIRRVLQPPHLRPPEPSFWPDPD